MGRRLGSVEIKKSCLIIHGFRESLEPFAGLSVESDPLSHPGECAAWSITDRFKLPPQCKRPAGWGDDLCQMQASLKGSVVKCCKIIHDHRSASHR